MAGHWLTYLVGLPSGHLRGEVLLATGHGYWSSAVELAVLAGLATVAVVARREVRAAFARELTGGDGPAAVAARLAVLQVMGFTALEVGERVSAGAPLAGLLQHHLFLLGVLVQLVVALVTALLLFLLARAVRTVARTLLSPRVARAAGREWRPPILLGPVSAIPSGGAGPRAPPSD
jgi:hypothetical protein